MQQDYDKEKSKDPIGETFKKRKFEATISEETLKKFKDPSLLENIKYEISKDHLEDDELKIDNIYESNVEQLKKAE